MTKTEIITAADQQAKRSLTPRALTAAEFQGLAEVPPELEWFANIANAKTRREEPCSTEPSPETPLSAEVCPFSAASDGFPLIRDPSAGEVSPFD